MDYIRNLLQIKCCEPGKPNLYADVDLKLIFANKASRTVKYFYIYAVPFNRAWDVIQCNLRHYTQFAGQITGRIAPDEEYDAVWDCAWCNITMTRAAILGIDIEYMDGTRKTFDRHGVNVAFGYPKLTRGYTPPAV